MGVIPTDWATPLLTPWNREWFTSGTLAIQTCSACGASGGRKPLNVRQWTCTACGAAHDRDINAAVNILALGRRDRLNACGDGVRPPLAVAAVSETGTLRGAA